MYEWLIENKELLKLFYGLFIGIICLIIVLRSDKIFRLSLHQGVRYFRNAFLFFGIAFAVRYFVGFIIYQGYVPAEIFSYSKMVFEFFIIMAGFFIFYSLIWKQVERSSEPFFSSILNPCILIFYLMTIIFITLDSIWGGYTAMFFSQIFLFTFAAGISFTKFLEKRRRKFLKFYFTAMALTLIAWTINALAVLLFRLNDGIIINTYILNLIVFLLFLYGVMDITRK